MGKNKKKMELIMTVLILTASFYIGRLGGGLAASGKSRTGTEGLPEGLTVAVDAGHGGIDAGKVSAKGLLEKDVNLSIAKKLKDLLEQEHIKVLMTRTDDNGLYDEGEPNKKQQDMKRRCALIDEGAPILAVSIHQNSYTQESVKGPQVFFYATSEEGRALAQKLQDSLNQRLEVERPRAVKANDSYYLLRKTAAPIVIVECGFLSNPQEAQLLAKEEYQQKVAEALCDGILEYILEKSAE